MEEKKQKKSKQNFLIGVVVGAISYLIIKEFILPLF